MAYAATYWDGYSARGVAAEVTTEGHYLVIRLATGGRIGWPVAEVRDADPREARSKVLRLRRLGTEERLTVGDSEAAKALRTAFPDLAGRNDKQNRVWRPVLFWGGGAIVSVVLMFWLFLPALAEVIADAIPPRLAHRFGELIVPEIAAAVGGTADGMEAICADSLNHGTLSALSSRVRPIRADPPLYLRVWVVRSPVVNAVALPGGHVVVFSGLLDFVESGDELAGVLAHEFGHVLRRHPIRITVEKATLSAVFGLFFGDISGGTVLAGVTTTLLGSAYSRDMEREADDIGVELMLRGGLDPRALGRFFERLQARQGDVEKWLGFFNTHPTSAERAETVDVAPERVHPIPERQWEIVRTICDR